MMTGISFPGVRDGKQHEREEAVVLITGSGVQSHGRAPAARPALRGEGQVVALGRDVASFAPPGGVFVEPGKAIKLASPSLPGWSSSPARTISATTLRTSRPVGREPMM